MTVIKFLVMRFPGLIALSVAASLASGLSAVGLLAFIIRMLKGVKSANFPWQLVLICLGGAFILSRAAASLAAAHIDGAVVGELRMQLAERILSAPLWQLEQIGTPRLLTALTQDPSRISSALPRIALFCTNISTVAGCLVYLSAISVQQTLVILTIVITGVVVSATFLRYASDYFLQAAKMWDRLSKNFEALTAGIKQLQLNSVRRHQLLFQELLDNQRWYKRLTMRATALTTAASNWGQLSFLLAVGFLLALSHSQDRESAEVASRFLLIVIYMMGPLGTAVLTASAIGQANIAFARIRELGLILSHVEQCSLPRSQNEKRQVGRLELHEITYTYGLENSFTFGPIDLVLDPGEVVFVSGSNGSGKSTFAKLLTGLYSPKSGDIYIGTTKVDDAYREHYRECFSAVFDDPYLFETVIGDDCCQANDQAQEYLYLLQLENVVRIHDARYSTTTALSRGQKKRLALISAFLENRPIYVFDEWAADQDAAFRKFFYVTLLAELKRRGKMVVVISHDEQYYSVADRIIKFFDGKLVEQSGGPDRR